MYLNPIAAPMIDAEGKPVEYDKNYLRDHFEEFYEDAFEVLPPPLEKVEKSCKLPPRVPYDPTLYQIQGCDNSKYSKCSRDH